MKLYELTNDLMELEQLLDEGEEVEEIMAIIMEQIASKGDGIMSLVRNIESDVESLKNEVKRLEGMIESREKKAERLREYLMRCMLQANIKSLPTVKGTISVRNNQPKVVIEDESKIPEGFKTVKEVTSVNKKELRESLKNGERIEGCHLESSQSLIIK